VGSSSRRIDRLSATFDDPSLVANAGLLLPQTLAGRLGVESEIDRAVTISGPNGQGFRPGRKVMSLVSALLAGGSHIDHVDMLRSGSTEAVLPFRLMAPSTLGSFLRSFTFGHVRQLDKVNATLIERAWALGAGPGKSLVIDIDATICDAVGKQKQGADNTYSKQFGYNPVIATRADTGEILHARMRRGKAHSRRGAKSFVSEVDARVRRASPLSEVTMRFDSGFFSFALLNLLEKKSVRYTITIPIVQSVKDVIESVSEDQWREVHSPDGSVAYVAETTYRQIGRYAKDRNQEPRRLIVQRKKFADPSTLQLFPHWHYHAFITDLDGDAVELNQFHREHARVELAIKDLKEGSGLEHFPSGKFFANAAWLECAVIAHNLLRWTRVLGEAIKPNELTVARTQRTRLLSVPGRIVNRSGTPTLRLPANWPWANVFINALAALRALPKSASG
jgi:hypothetical protein